MSQQRLFKIKGPTFNVLAAAFSASTYPETNGPYFKAPVGHRIYTRKSRTATECSYRLWQFEITRYRNQCLFAFFSPKLNTNLNIREIAKIYSSANHGVLSAFQIAKTAFDVCLHLRVLTSKSRSGSNPLNIVFSIEILQYLSVNYVVALICHKAGMSPTNVGVSSLMSLERQKYTIYQKAYEVRDVCLSSPLQILTVGNYVRFQIQGLINHVLLLP